MASGIRWIFIFQITVSAIINYINNQKEHHKKKTFMEEYKLFLEKFEVDYEDQYIFHEPE